MEKCTLHENCSHKYFPIYGTRQNPTTVKVCAHTHLHVHRPPSGAGKSMVRKIRKNNTEIKNRMYSTILKHNANHTTAIHFIFIVKLFLCAENGQKLFS